MTKEILLVADAVSNEKGVSKEKIFEALESAISIATKKKYEGDVDIRVVIDRKLGSFDTFRRWFIVEDNGCPLANPFREIGLEAAVFRSPESNFAVGDYLEEQIESIEFCRITTQIAKQVIVQKVREAEREQVVEKFKEKIGEIVTGIIRKSGKDFVIVDIGDNADAILRKEDMLPRETFKVGDRVRALLVDASYDSKSYNLVLSRTKVDMLVALFKLEIPEIDEDLIEIKGCSRDVGLRSKISVKSNDKRIDPVGACVGMRGARVQAASTELGGERIDIISWDENPVEYVINAMAPAEIVSVVVDEDTMSMDIAVNEDSLAKAIGRNGQNIRLASQLTGWHLKVMTVDEMNNKSEAESKKYIELFVNNLDIDESTASLLFNEGFRDLQELAYVPFYEFESIDGLSKEDALAIQEKSKDKLNSAAEIAEDKIFDNIKVTHELLKLDNIDENLAYVLANSGIKSIEDLAEKSIDELIDIEGLDEKKAGDIIMSARNLCWFS